MKILAGDWLEAYLPGTGTLLRNDYDYDDMEAAYNAGAAQATATERERIVNIINTLAIREPTDEEIVELEFTSGPLENEGEAWAWYRDCDLLDAIQEADDDPC